MAKRGVKRTRIGDPAESYGYVDYYKLEEKFKSALEEKLPTAGLAKEATLSSILAQLDITLSALRDALRGTGSKTLTDLDTDLSNLKDKFTPILKGSVFNTSITANTNIFGSDLSPTNSPTTFRIYACFSAAGVLTVRRTKAGVTVGEQLNAGASLNANAAYIFDVLLESGETINLQYSVNATALKLAVYEVPSVIS
jgi:hypothetical protein